MASKEPQKSPHIFADVKKFYDVQYIYTIVTICAFTFIAMQTSPLIGLYICDTVRGPAATTLAFYLAVTWTSFQPPLPFHLVRSYVVPIYLAFLYLYQHPNNGDCQAGLDELTEAFHHPLSFGASAAGIRFYTFCYVVMFTAFRLFGFCFMKSHSLAPGEKPRIIVSSDGAYPSIHGVATFHTHITKRLMKDGYPVHVITGSPAFLPKDQHQICGAPCSRIPCIFTTVGPQTPLGIPNPVLISKIFFGFRPHLVHVLEPGSALNMFIVLFCWMMSIPTMTSHHTHTMEYRFSMSSVNTTLSKYILFSHYRLVISSSDLHVVTAKMLTDRSIPGVVSWNWLQVRVPNGMLPKFWPTGSNEDFKIDHYNEDMRNELSKGNPDAHLIVHVGRFVAEKNIMEYVPVIIELCKKYGDKVQFALVGWGPLLKPFLKEIADAGFEDRVKAMNTLTGERLYQAYASSDIFFSPSGSEAYPIVYLEAMRSGLTVIAPSGPNAGGSQDTFVEDVHGFKYPRGDAAAAVVAVEKAMRAGKSMQDAIIKRGQWHSWKRTMDVCLDFYDQVLFARDVIHELRPRAEEDDA